MKRSTRRKGGGRSEACETTGGTTRDVLAPLDGNYNLPSPATPQKFFLGLAGSGLRMPPLTPNAERLHGGKSEPGAPSTPSTPSARTAGPLARPYTDLGDGRAVGGAPSTRTPEVSGKRAAVYSRRGHRSSGGNSRSHRKRRRGRAMSTAGLPGLTGRLDDEEYREQQRVAREEKLAGRAQETTQDQARKDEAIRKLGSGRRKSTAGCVSPSSSTFHVVPRRRHSASAALGIYQPRPRKQQCGQTTCGWTPSAPDVRCVACPGQIFHSTTVALCAACRRCLPDGKATHLRLERQQRARTIVQRCRAVGASRPEVIVRNLEPTGDCLCFREDCLHAFFLQADRKPDVCRRCGTCNQQKKGGKWYTVGANDCDGITVGGVGVGAEHVLYMDCRACYDRKRKARAHEAAVKSTSQADVMERPRLPPMERVRERVKDAIACGDIVDWRERLFGKPIIRQEDGMWTVDLVKGVKLLATAWFFCTRQRSLELEQDRRATSFLRTVT